MLGVLSHNTPVLGEAKKGVFIDHHNKIARTSFAQGQEGSRILVETY